MADNNKGLQGKQLAAALAESIYRRSGDNFNIQILRDLDLSIADELRQVTVEAASYAQRGANSKIEFIDGYYYNKATGFVGQIVKDASHYYVVFRGTDSAEAAWRTSFWRNPQLTDIPDTQAGQSHANAK